MAREQQFHDVVVDEASIPFNGVISAPSLVLIRQGFGESQRLGRQILVRSLAWRYRVQLLPVSTVAALNPGATVRCILFMDRQANGAAAVVTDILETAVYQAFVNKANQERFLVMYDETWHLNHSAATEVGGLMSFTGEVAGDFVEFDLEDVVDYSGADPVIEQVTSMNFGILLIGLSDGPTALFSKVRVTYEG